MSAISSKSLGVQENRYHYNAKEKQDKEFGDGTGLELYDFGARLYDPQIGRWQVQDPIADKFHSSSPFAYVTNSPIKIMDPDGNDWFTYNGEIMWNDSRKETLEQGGHKWKNIGNSITITTTSFINTPNDLPVPEGASTAGAGEKLKTVITLTGNYDKDGKFGGFTYDYSKEVGATFNLSPLQGKDVPGELNSAVGMNYWDGKNSLKLGAHVTTPNVETFGLKIIGSNVDVNHELNITLNNGKLSIDIAHGTYPSVGINIQGTANYSLFNWYNYQQQSFIQSHATRFWAVTTPLWVIAPEFMLGMIRREAQAKKDHLELNKLYQNNNKVTTTTLNDFKN